MKKRPRYRTARFTRTALAALLLCAGFSTTAFAQGYKPEIAAGKMTVAQGFNVTLTAAEPFVRQPVSIEFDDRGRLWVIQYLQYPNPAGLKRVKVDRYSRTTYDRVPEPPPRGPRGDDRITILEDTNGDGRTDRAKDFVAGLNLTTGFAFGYGGVFVLNVPYLLFYPDRDGDDVPDGDPEVLLAGFGMEDTSSLANSLIFGPDGWLYGTQGTNITADIRGIQFEQGVWRYHPRTKEFELFCEGGGNSWGLDFDPFGNLLYSTNYGGFLMHHGMQGAYYEKYFEKHGELHNPFAFGYFSHVPHEAFRGGHVTVGGFVYQADSFPKSFRGKYVGADLLGHAVYDNDMIPNGSTFRSRYAGTLLAANDTWFAPSDIMLGPDGAVYVADWHDKRTAHPDPDADWDRSNGRVYRIQANDADARRSTLPAHVDPNTLTSAQLVARLSHPNIWHVRRALRVLAERRDESVVPRLKELALTQADDVLALRAVWGVYVSGGFNEPFASQMLAQRHEALRAWTVRFLGDGKSVSPAMAAQLTALADNDPSPMVAAQLACSARRLPADVGLDIVARIARRDAWAGDAYIPLLCWWGVEQHVRKNASLVLNLFASTEARRHPIVRDVILGRLVRRLAAEGTSDAFARCAQLIQATTEAGEKRRLLAELDTGLALIDQPYQTGLPLGAVYSELAERKSALHHAAKRFNAVPAPLAPLLTDALFRNCNDPALLRLAIRLGDGGQYRRTIELASDINQPDARRLALLDVLGEVGDNACVAPVLDILKTAANDPLRGRALAVLARYDAAEIPGILLALYPQWNEKLQSQARSVLFGRSNWATAFLTAVDQQALSEKGVAVDELRLLAVHHDKNIDALVRKHWGEIRAGTPEEKLAEIRRLSNDLRAAAGSPANGKALFTKHCGTCHQLFGEGNKVGPDLTTANRKDQNFLLASLVDPSAQIRREYFNYVVVTGAGRVLTGLLAEQTAAAVTVVNAKNERITVARNEIEEIKPADVSLMPDNIVKQLSPQDIRDLFSYLQK